MTYQTSIPDDFKPPQFIDEKWREADAALGRKRAGAPWCIALARPDLDPSSRVHFCLNDTEYKLGDKKDHVAMMHILRVGAGRVRCGHREVPQVEAGDMVLVNLREAGHWIVVAGISVYLFTSDVAMARVYRTDKPTTPPFWDVTLETQEEHKARRAAWEDALYWNTRDVLNDFVILGRDPSAEQEMRNGPNWRIATPDSVLADGFRSDNLRDNRFPTVFRRVLGAGPGRTYRKEVDGLPEWQHSAPEVVPGDILALSRNVKTASFMFQGMPLEIMRASSVLLWDDFGGPQAAVEESVPTPVKFDAPAPDEDEQAPPTLITGKG